MKINLSEIYAGLEAWRDERRLTTKSQKEGYIVNVMEEFGELAEALRDYEKYTDYFKDCVEPFGYEGKGSHYDIKKAEHEIIDALCDIAVFTINAGADIPCDLKRTEIQWGKSSLSADYILKQLVEKCAEFSYFEWKEAICFNTILANCAYLCEHYGFNFEIAMLETIKEISSRTGSYDEIAKKWIKDVSFGAKAKWYKADYEKARIEK